MNGPPRPVDWRPTATVAALRRRAGSVFRILESGTIAVGDARVRRDVRTGYSYLAASDPRVHVGLGAATSVETITVRWPDGTRESFGPFPADRIAEISQKTVR